MLRQALPCIQGRHTCCPGGVHGHGGEARRAHHPSHATRVHASRDAGPPGASVLQKLAVKRLSGPHRSILAQLLALLLLQGSHSGRGRGCGRGRSCSHGSSSCCLCEVSGGPGSVGGEAQAPCTTCIPGAEAGAPRVAPTAVHALLHVALAGTAVDKRLLAQALRGGQGGAAACHTRHHGAARGAPRRAHGVPQDLALCRVANAPHGGDHGQRAGRLSGALLPRQRLVCK